MADSVVRKLCCGRSRHPAGSPHAVAPHPLGVRSLLLPRPKSLRACASTAPRICGACGIRFPGEQKFAPAGAANRRQTELRFCVRGTIFAARTGLSGGLSLGLFDACPHAQAWDDSTKPVGRRWTILKRSGRQQQFIRVTAFGCESRRSDYTLMAMPRPLVVPSSRAIGLPFLINSSCYLPHQMDIYEIQC
jgi:hypothetical protein